VVLALAGLGVARIAVANRNQERSVALAADLAPIDVNRIGLERASLAAALPGAAILINTTSLGWHPGESPLDLDLLERLPENALVVDLTYRDTDLLAAARSRGLGTLDGLPMLVYQGAAAFSRWTGVDAPIAVMLAAALIARDARR
jgi:shikimate dehydrogenase